MIGRALARRLGRALVAAALAAATACGGGAGADGGITGATVVGTVAAVSISSPTVTLEVGGSTTLQAQALDPQGHALPRSIVWSSSDTTIVRVSSDGRVTGVAVGRAEVAANVEGKFTKATVTVGPRAVATVQLSPDAARLMVGARMTLVAHTLHADGSELTGRVVTWTTTDPRIVSVDSVGTIEGRAPGVATVTATSEGHVASVGVTVVAVPVAALAVAPATDTLVVGQSTQLSATATDSAGGVLAGRTIAWSSSDPAVASVSSSGLVLAAAPGAVDVTASAEGRSAAAHVVVVARPVASVIVSPSSSSLAVGDTLRLEALVTDASGAVLAGRAVAFASSDTTVARVSADGVVTATGLGSATITATSGSATGTATVTVAPANVASLDLQPAAASLTVGDTLTVRATALDAAGHALAGRVITWTSGAPGVVSAAPNGKLTALGAGTAVILATSGRASATMTVTVRAVPAAGVRILPSSLVMLVGDARDLAATAVDAGGNALPYPITFASSDERVAVVSSAGRVLALALGTVQITASAGGAQGTATVSVVPDPVVAVAVSGMPPSLLPGATAQLSAAATNRFGTAVTGRPVTWATSDAAVATVSPGGLVTAVGAGSAVISATIDGVTGSTTASVSQVPVARVTIALGTGSLQPAQTTQATATAYDAAGNALAGRAFAFTTSNAAVATVSASGVVTAVADGTATITASAGGQSASATVTVTTPATPPPPPPPPPSVATVAVSLASPSLTVGQGTAATATLRDASGNVLTGRPVTWATSDPAIATVSTTGAVTAVAAGTATISATSGGVTGSATLTVTAVSPPPPPPPPAVASITVSLGTASLPLGNATLATATVRDAAGNVLTGRTVTWASSDLTVATVAPSGAVIGVGLGSATISATSGGVTGSASVTVVAQAPAPVAAISVSLGSASLVVGQSTGATATLRDAAGNVLTGRPIAWTTSNASVATVSSSGQVVAVAPGTATITATSGSASGSASLTVSAPPPAPVATVSVSLGASSLVTGGSTTASATLRDAAGNVLTGRPVTWASSDASIATVSASGGVTAVAPGTVTISATSGGVTGSATLTVTAPPPAPVASIAVSLGSTSLTVGSATSATATLRDAAGNVLTGRPLTWASSDPTVATVSPSGGVIAVGVGSATISATSGGVTGSAALTVTAPPPAPVAAVSVTLGASTLAIGATTTATATLSDASGNVLTGRPIAWTSSDPSIATVSSSGVVTAVSAGSASITATSGGVSGSAGVTVQQPPPPPAPVVARIDVRPGAINLKSGKTPKDAADMAAIAYDASDNVILTAKFTWSIDDPSVAALNVNSLLSNLATVVALNDGDAVVTVRSGSVSATVKVKVR
ncbi:Ig domain protein group 2 domain protein [Gemmatirosa kalamazoonensis]|uniref:Ig domain protein group 2 domain protein n=1 Tax=Gemmatirosa kalamazoonensis TaxID=861299 RepID=W0RLJ1_9BACT|nr:Ig-like domain-containing protein [Gemmatirosa kalamazoonensis]AHG91641.1 Ig domain protein group 2 domain protein [Gemmatirosa kalamazoonensis]